MQAFEIIGGILLILMACNHHYGPDAGGKRRRRFGAGRRSAPELRQEQSKNAGCAPFQIYESDRRGFSRCNFSGLDFKHLFLIMAKSPAVGRAFLLHAFALWNLS